MEGITYDENAALYVGASYPESEKNETEILLLDTKSEEEDTGLSVRSGSKTAKELEVRLIAQRIGELMESQQIVDKETGMLRPVRYQDIVIPDKEALQDGPILLHEFCRRRDYRFWLNQQMGILKLWKLDG